MRTYNLISADSHINIPRDIYEKYAPAAYKARCPRVESNDQGDFWVFEGRRSPAVHGLSVMAGRQFEEFTTSVSRFSEVRPSSWDPKARVADQDIDGVDAEVIYFGGMQGDQTQDLELRLVMYRVYNDWLADFCNGAPGRLVGLAAVPMWHVELACAEARRAARLGLKGAIIPSWAPDGKQYHESMWEPVWSAFEDLGMPVSMHLGARMHWVRLDQMPPAYLAVSKLGMAEPVAIMLFGGVLARHPRLQLVMAETGIGWLPYFKEWSEHIYVRHRFWSGLHLPEPPSRYFDRQMFATFQEDKAGVFARHLIGVDNIMWASDFPHSDTTWPQSRNYIADHFVGVPDEERHKIVAGNAARLYGLTA